MAGDEVVVDAKSMDEKKAAMAAFHFRFCKDPDVLGTINHSPQKNQRDLAAISLRVVRALSTSFKTEHMFRHFLS